MEKKVYLTKEGFEKIRKELEELKNKTRPSVVERLALARMQGDLSENNEYSSARGELAFIDGRIEEVEDVLKRAVLMEEPSGPREAVCLGCKVTVSDGKKEQIYHIVGEWEANPAEKKVSRSSPLGRALLGKKAGERVEFEAPAGKVVFKILKID
ncbi:MAG TPA: transcription elongation factor GreA [Clostridia bacterium]|nr:transcription elongation factor GreA [Clostridia bacterium]